MKTLTTPQIVRILGVSKPTVLVLSKHYDVDEGDGVGGRGHARSFPVELVEHYIEARQLELAAMVRRYNEVTGAQDTAPLDVTAANLRAMTAERDLYRDALNKVKADGLNVPPVGDLPF